MKAKLLPFKYTYRRMKENKTLVNRPSQNGGKEGLEEIRRLHSSQISPKHTANLIRFCELHILIRIKLDFPK